MNNTVTPTIYRKASSNLFYYKIMGTVILKVSAIHNFLGIEISTSTAKQSDMDDMLECSNGYMEISYEEFLEQYNKVFNQLNPLAFKK